MYAACVVFHCVCFVDAVVLNVFALIGVPWLCCTSMCCVCCDVFVLSLSYVSYDTPCVVLMWFVWIGFVDEAQIDACVMCVVCDVV